ncbi:hydroxypyruvate reductase [Amylibacter kogurei]|uniref:Hydroxypyruvate reductase n=1 Tax=Paramylibacter kogurei TaxID=1889778 RepID=A0A2G5K6Q7_9RHOB|nr:glycerate kinase [Amylibacter kogurei]PIB24560.1 hydroxypyruvate reductase [Amylibacter kogurei]
MPYPITDPRQFLTSLFLSAVRVADPLRVVAPYLPPRPKGRLVVIGAGKASARMAEAVEKHYGPCEGLVITRYGYARECEGIEIVEAAHPVPDAAGETATRHMIERVSSLGPNDLVLALISGGGSALLCAPIDGVSLNDKIELNQKLLSSGAPIGDMNIVRKHLSRVKGGQLAAACYPAQLLTLMISDVPGDDPAMIASGPTVGDTSTAQDAFDILDRYNIKLSDHLRRAIAKSSQVIAPDHPKLQTTKNQIVAAPSMSLSEAARIATDANCEIRELGDAIEGEARNIGQSQAKMAMSLQSHVNKTGKPLILLSGGECTVTRRGDGIGGPNAEFVLATAITLNGHPNIHVIAADTDGVDGAAEVAGAYAGPETLAYASKHKMDPKLALANNNAHGFFAKVGGQIITGPTLTNVNDFRAILICPS